MSAPRKEKLRWHVDALHKLLADPQPGLSSWVAMYAEHMEAIVAIWFIGDEKREPIHTRDLCDRLQTLANFQESESLRLNAIAFDTDDVDHVKAKSLEAAAKENREWAAHLYDMKAKL